MKIREAFEHCVEKIRDNIGRNLFKGDWDLNEKKFLCEMLNKIKC